MQVHTVNLIKTLLVKDSRNPKLLKFLVHPLCVMLIQNIAQLVKTALATIYSEHL